MHTFYFVALCRFAVTPLTEDCGILEWVQKTGTLRHSVQRVYVQEGLFHNRTNQVIQRLYDTHAAAHPKVCIMTAARDVAPAVP